MSKRIICLRCRHERHHEARGLCKSCTRHLRQTGDLELYPRMGRGRPPKPKPERDDDAFAGTWVRRGLTYYPQDAAS